MTHTLKAILLAGAASAMMIGTASADSHGDITACLITKTDTNPFFVKMREGATEAAEAAGITLQTYAGAIDGDVESQVAAVETCIAAGASGILITPTDSRALAPVINQAREAGLLVIALDTPFEPADVADATFATDNFRAGELIGMWAAATIDDPANARIATLDLNPSEVSVDYLRNQGFLTGFGIEVNDPTDIGDEDDERIVGSDVTNGNEEGGRTAMENLLQIDPGINVVYTINEPAAAGAYEALNAQSDRENDQVMIVSVDGGCPGIARMWPNGVIGATSHAIPAADGLARRRSDCPVRSRRHRCLITSEGLDFFNTGVSLVTDQAVRWHRVHPSRSQRRTDLCWG